MLKKLINITILVLILSVYHSAQDASTDAQNELKRGDEIIGLARSAVYKKLEKANLKAIRLKKTTTRVSKEIKQIEGGKEISSSSELILENNMSLELPNKLKQSIVSYRPKENSNENYTKVEIVSDGEKLDSKSEIVRNGKIFNIAASLAKLPTVVSSSVKEQLINATENLNRKGQKVDLQPLTIDVLPILLDLPWDSEIKYTYRGKAKSANTTADIVEVNASQKEIIQMFFDEKSHLLLMMTVKSSNESENKEERYYFSNYQLVDGIMIAKKINYESKTINNKQIAIEGLPKMLGYTEQITAETVIDAFETNPSFKSGYFSVEEK